MSKHNQNNLRIKRKYLLWLKDARGLSEASVDKVAASISTYEQFLKGKDFRAFHIEQARGFKRYLTALRPCADLLANPEGAEQRTTSHYQNR